MTSVKDTRPNLKGLILAAGRGTNLRPFTHTLLKPLMPIANKPIIFYIIEDFVRCNIADLGIVVGKNSELLETTVGDGSRWGIRITYIIQQEPKGVAHAVKQAEQFIGKSSFILYLGDILREKSIADFVQEFSSSSNDARVLIKKSVVPHKFGVVELNDKKEIISLEEKPINPKSNFVLIGIYAFKESIFEAINHITPSKRNELELTDAINWLVTNKKIVCADLVEDWWHDTGRPESFIEANQFVLMNLSERTILGSIDKNSQIIGHVDVGKGTVILEGVAIMGPVVIGENCKIGPNVIIGPYTSIGNDVVIKHSEIDNSIIMDGTEISDISRRITGSILGHRCILSSKEKTKQDPSHKLFLGDNSHMEL